MSNSRIMLVMTVAAWACGGSKDSGGSGGSAAGGGGSGSDAPKPSRVACVDLPGAPRSDLQTSKDGKTLYYVEETTKKLGDERVTTFNLYALDVATKTPKLLVSDVSPGVAIAPNGTVVFRRLMPKDADKEQRWDGRRHHQLMTMAPDKEPVAITDGKDDVGDVELDPKTNTIAFLQGDFYPDKLVAVPLAGGSPQLLLEHTYNILGIEDGVAYVNSMRQLKKQPLPSGAPTDLGMLINPVVGVANGLIITKQKFGGGKYQIAPVATPDKANDLPVAGDKLGLAKAGDKAYVFTTKPDGYEVASLVAGKLTPVLVAKGARPYAAAPAGDKLAVLAIVDSDGDGELGLDDEADVCFVTPGTEVVDMPSRTIPKRFVEVASRLAPLWKGPLAGANIRFTTIGTVEYLQLSIAKADGDLRKLVAATQDEVTRKSGLAQLSLIISERDTGRRAVSRWDDRAKAFLTSSGIGLAQVADRTQYQIEVDPHVSWRMAARSYGSGESTIGTATCSGTIKNISDKPLVDVEAECSNEMRYGGESRQKAKVAPSIAPNASAPYKVELGVADSERGVPLVITAQGTHLSYLNTYSYKRNEEIATAAQKVADETKLAYWKMDSVLEGQSYSQKRWLKIYVRSFLPPDKVEAAAEAALPKLAAMAKDDRNYEGTPMLLVIKGDTDTIGWSLKDGRFSEGEPKENTF